MPLVLTIVRQPEGSSVTDTRKLFTESGGTLGRSADNSWSLPDPSRFVSSHHASIRYDRGDYYLVDTSTNGVYVNSNNNPLGTGNQVRLQTGDKLYLGEYEIHVEFEQSDVPQSAMSSDDFDQWLDPQSNEPEAASNDFNDLLTPEQELLDPLAALDKAKAPSNDPWQGSSQADNAALPDQAFIPPDPILESAAPPPPPASGAAGVIPDDWDLDDLLSDEPAKPQEPTPVVPESAAASPSAQSLGGVSTATDPIPDDDLLGDIDALLDGPEEELLTPEQNAAKADGNELDAFLGIDSAEPETDSDSLAALLDATPSVDEPAAAVAEDLDLDASLSGAEIEPEVTAPPAMAAEPPQPEVPSPVTAELPAVSAPPPKPEVPQPAAKTPPPKAQPQVPTPPAPPVPPAAPVPDSLLDASASQPAAPAPQPSSDSCDALIRSLGLDPDLMSAETRKNFQRVLADTLRETVGGMMKVLGARNAIKNEFRMNVTMIQPMENNPLKFSPNVDEALRNMFTSQSNAYMPGTIAIREGFQDVADHQVAVIAGMRAAFRSLLKRFEPETLQVRFDKQHQAGFLSSKKGKYWEAYGDFYRDLSDNMDDAFQDLFGEDFAEAYEQQMARLEASRKK